MVVSPLSPAASMPLLRLQLLEHGVEPSEVAFPVSAVGLPPPRGFPQRPGVEPARPPPCVAAAGDEPRAPPPLEGLGDCRLADVAGGGRPRGRGLAPCKTGE